LTCFPLLWPIYTTGSPITHLSLSARPPDSMSVCYLLALRVWWQQQRWIKLIPRPISLRWQNSCPSTVRMRQRTTRRNRSTSTLGVAGCWHISYTQTRNNNSIKKYITQTNNKLWCTYWPSKLNIMVRHVKIKRMERWHKCKLRGGRNPSNSVSAHASSSSSRSSLHRVGLVGPKPSEQTSMHNTPLRRYPTSNKTTIKHQIYYTGDVRLSVHAHIARNETLK